VLILTDQRHVCVECKSAYFVTADDTYAEGEDLLTHDVHPLDRHPTDPARFLCPACGGELVNVHWVDEALSLQDY